MGEIGLQVPIPGLSDRAREKYAEVWPQLLRNGNARLDEADVVARYCQAWDDWVTAGEEVRKLGRLVKQVNAEGGTRVVRNPYLSIQIEASDRMDRLARQLRLTPETRAGLPEYLVEELLEHTTEADNVEAEQDGKAEAKRKARA